MYLVISTAQYHIKTELLVQINNLIVLFTQAELASSVFLRSQSVKSHPVQPAITFLLNVSAQKLNTKR